MLHFDGVNSPSSTPPPMVNVAPAGVGSSLSKLDTSGFTLPAFTHPLVSSSAGFSFVTAAGVFVVIAGLALLAYFFLQHSRKFRQNPRGFFLRSGVAAVIVAAGLIVCVGGSAIPASSVVVPSVSNSASFVKWANHRYGVNLTSDEVSVLESGSPVPIALIGIRNEIHPDLSAGKLYLFSTSGVELPLSAAVTGVVSGG